MMTDPAPDDKASYPRLAFMSHPDQANETVGAGIASLVAYPAEPGAAFET